MSLELLIGIVLTFLAILGLASKLSLVWKIIIVIATGAVLFYLYLIRKYLRN